MVHTVGCVVGGRKWWLEHIQSLGIFIFNRSCKILIPSHSYSMDQTRQQQAAKQCFLNLYVFRGPQLDPIIKKKSLSLPLTCQMLTIFSIAEAKYFPVTLQARGDKQGSLGDPKPDMPSSEPSLKRENRQMKNLIPLKQHGFICLAMR